MPEEISPENAAMDAMLAELREFYDEADMGGSWRQIGGGHATYTGGSANVGDRLLMIRGRTEGRWHPFYEDELDLRANVARCRSLATFTSIAVGATEALSCYVMGGEWEYTAASAAPETQEAPEELLTACQRIIDRFLDANEIVGDLDTELFEASVIDGESLVGMYPRHDGSAQVVKIEPECMREPSNTTQLERWLDFKRDSTKWKFGVLTGYSKTLRRHDWTQPLGYHFIYDDGGVDWEFLPTWPAAGGDDAGRSATHFKRNVGRAAARGVSDFWALIRDHEREDKINDRTAGGVATLAGIPYIVEHPEGTTETQANADIASLRAKMQAVMKLYAETRRSMASDRTPHPANTALNVPKGKKYHAGPLGQVRSEIYLSVAQALKRRIAIRWLMPEYMISADASNANFASTLVSESPFVKSRVRDQNTFTRKMRGLVLKALKMAHDRGAFSRWVSNWSEFLQLVDVNINTPQVASTNPGQLTQRLQTLYQHGIIPPEEWAVEEGFDGDYAAEHGRRLQASGAGGYGGNLNSALQAAAFTAMEGAEGDETLQAFLESFTR